MSQSLSSRAASQVGPGVDYAPVTPADGQPLPRPATSLYVETGGFVRFVTAEGTRRTVRVPDFGWILCRVVGVEATGTTAGGVHAVLGA